MKNRQEGTHINLVLMVFWSYPNRAVICKCYRCKTTGCRNETVKFTWQLVKIAMNFFSGTYSYVDIFNSTEKKDRKGD